MQQHNFNGLVVEDKWGKTYLCSSCLLTYSDLGDGCITDIKNSLNGRYFLQDLTPQSELRQIWTDLYRQARPWQSDVSHWSNHQLRDALISLFAQNELRVWPLQDGWGAS